MKKKIKKFFVYFMFLLLVPIILAGAFFAILYFFQGTSILGYEYVNFEETIVKEFSPSDLSVALVNSVKIAGSSTKVIIEPNQESGVVELVYTQQVRGFTKSNFANAYVTSEYSVVEFEDSTGTFKSLDINITEPSGLLVSSGSVVRLKMPEEYYVSMIYCKNSKDIEFYSSIKVETEEISKTYSIGSDNVYLSTSGSSKITLVGSGVKTYNLKTENGNVVLSNGENFSAEKIKFETKTGEFNFSSNGTSKLELSSGLEVVSFDNKGAKVKIDTLLGDLTVNSTGGNFTIGTVGIEGTPNNVILNSTNSTFTFGSVYGLVSLQNGGAKSANNFVANSIVNGTTNGNTFEVGSGSVNISSLFGKSTFSSTSGKIYVGEIDKNSSVYALSESGEINLTYEENKSSIKSTTVNIFTNTGNIYLKNISGLLKVNVLSDSKNAKLDIVFTAVCNDESNVEENVIKAKDRDVSMTLKGFTDDFKFRYLTTTKPFFDTKILQSQVSGGQEYLLNKEPYKNNYSYQYRCGYKDGIATSIINANYGKLLVSTSGTARMFVSFT